MAETTYACHASFLYVFQPTANVTGFGASFSFLAGCCVCDVCFMRFVDGLQAVLLLLF
jgi:hypothetical protein